MADPVSWLMIETGWRVVAADGSEVGKVAHVVGDSSIDIFDGLAVATDAFGKPRYVPAERVGEITEGLVQVELTPDDVGRLGEYREPATSAKVAAGSSGGLGERLEAGLREIEAKVVPPIQEHERPVGLWQRIVNFFRRL